MGAEAGAALKIGHNVKGATDVEAYRKAMLEAKGRGKK